MQHSRHFVARTCLSAISDKMEPLSPINGVKVFLFPSAFGFVLKVELAILHLQLMWFWLPLPYADAAGNKWKAKETARLI